MSDTYTGVVRTYYDKEQTKLKEECFQVNGKKEGIKKLFRKKFDQKSAF